MKPYEWMTTYTPQREWIEKKGIFMPLAFYFGSLGGGLYLVSLFFESLAGMVLAWFIVAVLKGGAHLLDLGQPLRSWRMVLRPRSSWISRGLIFVALFLGLGFVHLCLVSFVPGSGGEKAFRVLAGCAALLTCVYPGFTLNFVNAIALWNTAILPVLFMACGFLGGFGLLTWIGVFGGDIPVGGVESGSMVLLLITAILIVTYAWSTSYTGPSGRRALKEMTGGRSSVFFWVGIVLLGIVMPFAAGLICRYVDFNRAVLFLGAAGEIICGVSLTYVIFRAGTYAPLVPGPAMDDRGEMRSSR